MSDNANWCRNTLRVPVIPSNGRIPVDKYKRWLDELLPQEVHDHYIRNDLFKDGIVALTGRMQLYMNKNIYFVGIDLDNELAIKEFCNFDDKQLTLQELADSGKFLIDQTDDKTRAHVYLHSTKPFKNLAPYNGNDINIPKLEVKCERRYITIAPTLHSNGSRRQFLNDDKSKSKFVNDLTSVDYIEEHIDTICRKYGLVYLNGKADKNTTRNKVPIDDNEIFYRGSREVKMYAFACRQFRKYYYDKTIGEIKNIIYSKNQKDCRALDGSLDPLEDNVIKTICNNAGDFVRKEIEKEASNNGNNADPKAKQVIMEASEKIMSKYTFITIEETGEIWFYDSGVYLQGGEIIIAKECEQMFDYDLNNERLSQIKGHIIRRTYHKHEELDADINIQNLKNGLYDVDNDVLMPHTPKYLSINQKPITYVKDAKPKLFGKFLSQVLYPRYIRTAIEAMAYTFHRDYTIEVIFILHGFGANGKTVYTSTLTELHGVNNVSNVTLSQMTKDIFALSDLENKDVNIDNELGSDVIKDTAVLKRLTGGSRQRIRIQRKNQRAYDTILYSKLFFNANKVPISSDESDAYNRRPIIIPFPHTFEGKDEDTELLSKLTTDEELSGIFNVLMNALRHIRKTANIYVNEKTIEERRNKYQRTANPIKTFMEEVVSEDSKVDDIVRKEDFYQVYIKYCEKYNLPIERYEPFCKDIKHFSFYDDDRAEIRETRKHIGETDKDGNRKKTYCWEGILLIPDYKLEDGQLTIV